MSKPAGGIGFVLLLIVVAAVLVLAARAWQSVAPTASRLSDDANPVGIDDRGQREAGEALRSGKLPDLNDVRNRTDAHSEQVQQALAETD